ncbi:MAG TPA: TAXI family TRAP transporter solute-binding subunit [Burkholderiales bacterium]|jgi:TRAP transporter TAXI family solute receptor|nr:TAXI family TRAP transporter solute-binding subunit [Burkholderiales bacterium]
MNKVIRWAFVAAAATVPLVFGPVAYSADVTHLTIVGAGKGAGAFREAGTIAETVNKNSKKINITNQESAGFVANTRMIANGRVELALSNGVFVDYIQRKEKPFHTEKKPATSIRGLGPGTASWFQIVVLKESGIKSLAELKGKRVSMGPKGSNTAYMMEIAFKEIGIFDSVRKDYLKWGDAANYMIDGKLDSFGIPNPIPSPSVLQAATSRPITVLDVPDQVIQKFMSQSKGYFEDTPDFSVYEGMKGKKAKTVAYGVFYLVHEGVPADAVYEICKIFYDPKNRDFILSMYKNLRISLDRSQSDLFLKQMKGFNLKLHPGAERYWKERGYAVN